MMTKTRKQKGFSIVEVVISLSVIVVVSVAALSIVLSSVAAKVNAINCSKAQSFAENVWESFKVANDEVEFVSFVYFSEGVMLNNSVSGGTGNNIYTYSSEENKFTAEITVSYPQNERPELSVSVTDEDGDTIVSFSYLGGGGT